MSKNQELYEAVRKGSLEQVENFLTEPGLDINKMYERGQETLLSAAVRKGSVALVDLLLENGANVDTATPTKTPLHMACYESDLRVAKCLVQHDADIEAADDTNRTALQWALRGGSKEVFEFLVKNNASTNRVATDGNTLLHDAMANCSSEFVLELMAQDLCDLDGKNKAGETPLFLAAAAGKVDVMRKLIAQGAKIDVMNDSDETLLHAAAHYGQLEVIEFLLETINLADDYINKQTNEQSFAIIRKIKIPSESWTALHFACALGHTDVARYLLGHGADRSIRTGDGLKPIELCKAYKQKHIIPVFEDRRASHLPEEEIAALSHERLHARRRTLPVTNKPDWVI